MLPGEIKYSVIYLYRYRTY